MSTLSQKEALADSFAYCWEILPHVSRTFALTIPVLNEPLRTQVGVSYLLCRIADTVEDTVGLSGETRAELFSSFRQLMREPRDGSTRSRFQVKWPRQPDPHHQSLLEHTGTVLDCYSSFPQAVRDAIAHCVDEMVGGMSGYPNPAVREKPVEICTDLAALEQYCHFVAGTVGILLSNLFAHELDARWMTPERAEQGRRFGLGLQLTNVLKDHGSDRGRGVTYVPEQWTESSDAGVVLSRDGARILIDRALEHLDVAQTYILSIPPARSDMRLFCLWAAHLALATLRIAAEGNHTAAKVDREELWDVLERARRDAGDDSALQGIHAEYRARVRAALAK